MKIKNTKTILVAFSSSFLILLSVHIFIAMYVYEQLAVKYLLHATVRITLYSFIPVALVLYLKLESKYKPAIIGIVNGITFAVLIITSNNYSIARLSFDDTEICLPEQFVSGNGIFSNYLKNNVKGLDSSDGQHILRFPAQLINDRFPDYSLTYFNKRNMEIKHSLGGLANRRSNLRRPNGGAYAAWSVFKYEKNPLVEKDESGFFRIYKYGKPTFMWSLVRTPPPKNGIGKIPDGWFVGHCLDNTAGLTCTQSIMYKDIYFQYHIQYTDLPIYHDIAYELMSLFEGWEQSCNSEGY